MKKTTLCFLVLWVCSAMLPAWSQAQPVDISLQDYVSMALTQSDTAFDLEDAAMSAQFSIDAADHAFDMRVVPLTTLGAFSGAGTKVLGLELRQKTEFGADVTAGLSASHLSSTDFVVSNSYSMQSYIRLSQGLFRRWGDRYNRLGFSKASLRAERKRYEASRSKQEIILAAVRHYHGLLLASRLVVTAEQALQRSRGHLEIARSRHKAGLVSKVDVYRAELAVLNAESVSREKMRAHERALDTFHEQLRIGGRHRYQPERRITRMIPVIPENWHETLPEQRPDWQAHLIDIEVAELDRFKVERDMLPDLSLNVSAGRRGTGDTFSQSTNLNIIDWSFQLQLHSSPDTFSEEMAVSREKIRMSRLHRQGESLKRLIMREARNAVEDLVSEDQRLAIAMAKTDQAGMALDLAKIRYERGLSNNIALLDAEGAYSEAEVELLRTRAGYNEKAVQVAYALGVLTPEWLALSLHEKPSQKE